MYKTAIKINEELSRGIQMPDFTCPQLDEIRELVANLTKDANEIEKINSLLDEIACANAQLRNCAIELEAALANVTTNA